MKCPFCDSEFDMEALNRWAETPFAIKRKENLLDNYEHSTMNGRIQIIIQMTKLQLF